MKHAWMALFVLVAPLALAESRPLPELGTTCSISAESYSCMNPDGTTQTVSDPGCSASCDPSRTAVCYPASPGAFCILAASLCGCR